MKSVFHQATFLCISISGFLCAVSTAAEMPPAGIEANTSPPIDAVILHPFTHKYFICAEHADGELPEPGDALGSDCAIETSKFGFKNEGKNNEDYDSWDQLLLAPVGGVVTQININPVINVPGKLGTSPASSITFQRDDGTNVLYAHVQGVMVQVGDRITAGQPVARIGNNGMATGPHLHVGVWKDKQAYQIRWDLHALAAIRKAAKSAAN